MTTQQSTFLFEDECAFSTLCPSSEWQARVSFNSLLKLKATIRDLHDSNVLRQQNLNIPERERHRLRGAMSNRPELIQFSIPDGRVFHTSKEQMRGYPYFKTMFDSEFREGHRTRERAVSEMGHPSLAMATSPESAGNTETAYVPLQQIDCNRQDYHTYEGDVKDVDCDSILGYLIWLDYGEIRYAPSLSTFFTSNNALSPKQAGIKHFQTTAREQREKWRQEMVTAHDCLSPFVPFCDAKTVYRVANIHDLPDLMRLSLENITSCLSMQNVAYEIFSKFSDIFPPVLQAILHWLSQQTVLPGEVRRLLVRLSRGDWHSACKSVRELLDVNYAGDGKKEDCHKSSVAS